MASVGEDEVIRHRLQIEGESGQDDKRITNLLRGYAKWVNSSEATSDDHETCQSLLDVLKQSECSMRQSLLIAKMNDVEFEVYNHLQKKIEMSIKSVIENVEKLKTDLVEANDVRKNRQQYDKIAKEIIKHPCRSSCAKEIEDLQVKLCSLESINKAHDERIEQRKKHFDILLFAARSIQQHLESEELPAFSDE